MKHSVKKIILGLAALVVFLSAYLPTRFHVQAAVGIPFGGLQTIVLGPEFCSCSGTNIHFVFDYKTKTELMLYNSPTSLQYDYHNLMTPGTYQLGSFIPGGLACMQNDGPDDPCQPILFPEGTYGDVPGTGSTLSDKNLGNEIADAIDEIWDGNILQPIPNIDHNES